MSTKSGIFHDPESKTYLYEEAVFDGESPAYIEVGADHFKITHDFADKEPEVTVEIPAAVMDRLTAAWITRRGSEDSSEFMRVGLKVAANIMAEWELAEQEQLLSHNFEQLITCSRLMSIQRSLKALSLTASTWLRTANREFDGQPALSVMLTNDEGLRRVQRYLQAQTV